MNQAEYFNAIIQTVMGHKNAIQALIVVLSVLAIAGLSSTKRSWRFVGCIIGLASEIFWFLSAYAAGQWGIVVLVGVYTFFYARGVRNNLKKRGSEGEVE